MDVPSYRACFCGLTSPPVIDNYSALSVLYFSQKSSAKVPFQIDVVCNYRDEELIVCALWLMKCVSFGELEPFLVRNSQE
jgi:hypothetical protein